MIQGQNFKLLCLKSRKNLDLSRQECNFKKILMSCDKYNLTVILLYPFNLLYSLRKRNKKPCQASHFDSFPQLV